MLDTSCLDNFSPRLLLVLIRKTSRYYLRFPKRAIPLPLVTPKSSPMGSHFQNRVRHDENPDMTYNKALNSLTLYHTCVVNRNFSGLICKLMTGDILQWCQDNLRKKKISASFSY